MGNERSEVDVLVLGGGPGGYSAAFHCAHAGFSTALVCEEDLGGVCLQRGCIPSKALLELAELRHRVEEAADQGMRWGEPEVDPAAIGEYRDSMIGRLSQGLEQLCTQRQVQRLRGRGRFTDREVCEVQGDEGTHAVRFGHAIIATGSRPVPLPPLAEVEDERIMDSAASLRLEDIPKRLVVVGGGYVGLEMATVYAALGSEVHVLEMQDRLLANADQDLVKPLDRRLKHRLAAVRLETTVTDVDTSGDELVVTIETGDGSEQLTADRLLVAVGRRPNSADLGLEILGVETDDGGRITIDQQCRTTRDEVFAVGDVATDLPLAHVAMEEGRIAAEIIAGGEARRAHRARPAVVYTDPQIAWCGLTEAEAAERGQPVQVLRNHWQANGRATASAPPTA